MKITGIIAEYNPFHNGHAYQIRQIREALRADCVIVVMSGDFVQRGEPALVEKHIRTEMALRCGADVVLELPVCASSASAEGFAMGGVSLLHQLKAADRLCFGAENDDPQLFSLAARILLDEPEPYKQKLRQSLKEGASFPSARCAALAPLLAEESGCSLPQILFFLGQPNNILGIEYAKAVLRLNSGIILTPVKRTGAGYRQESISPEGLSSAGALRRLLTSGKELQASQEILRENIPPEALGILWNALERDGFVTTADLNLLLQYRLLQETRESLEKYTDVTPALSSRILKQLNHYNGFSEFAGLLQTRSFTEARIRRVLLHILLGLEPAPSLIPYARILGFRKSSREVLREIKKSSEIPLISKAADAGAILKGNALQMFRETLRASLIYESILSQKAKRPFRHEFEKPLVIV